MTNKEKIAVIQAFEAGEVIECKHISWSLWVPSGAPQFDFVHYYYRVKTKPVECWANVYDSGAACYHDSKGEADHGAGGSRIGEARLMREVINEQVLSNKHGH